LELGCHVGRELVDDQNAHGAFLHQRVSFPPLAVSLAAVIRALRAPRALHVYTTRLRRERIVPGPGAGPRRVDRELRRRPSRTSRDAPGPPRTGRPREGAVARVHVRAAAARRPGAAAPRAADFAMAGQ